MRNEDIDAHWKYTKDIITLCVNLMGFLYKRALKHGYKHGYEDAKREHL